jgi:hypothetical protein
MHFTSVTEKLGFQYRNWRNCLFENVLPLVLRIAIVIEGFDSNPKCITQAS